MSHAGHGPRAIAPCSKPNRENMLLLIHEKVKTLGIEATIIDVLLSSGPFLSQLADKIGDYLFPDSDEEVKIPVDEIFKELEPKIRAMIPSSPDISELEPKIVSLIDSRIHGMEKRLNTKLDDLTASLKDELTRLLGVKPRPVLPTPVTTNEGVDNSGRTATTVNFRSRRRRVS